jgi:structural maintenance of chromosome 1
VYCESQCLPAQYSSHKHPVCSGDLSLGEEQLSEYNRRKEEAGAKTYKLKQERDVLEMEHTREHEELANLEANVAELDARAARLDAATQRTQVSERDTHG